MGLLHLEMRRSFYTPATKVKIQEGPQAFLRRERILQKQRMSELDSRKAGRDKNVCQGMLVPYAEKWGRESPFDSGKSLSV